MELVHRKTFFACHQSKYSYRILNLPSPSYKLLQKGPRYLNNPRRRNDGSSYPKGNTFSSVHQVKSDSEGSGQTVALHRAVQSAHAASDGHSTAVEDEAGGVA